MHLSHNILFPALTKRDSMGTATDQDMLMTDV